MIRLMTLTFAAACILAAQSATNQLLVPAPPAPVASASVIGNQGNATYVYYVVANYPSGAAVSTGATAVRAANTLTNTNYVNIGWSALPGVVTYDVVRFASPNTVYASCSLCVVVKGTLSTSANDNGETLTNYTAPPSALAANATVYIDNTNYAFPKLRTSIGNASPGVQADHLAEVPSGNSTPEYCKPGDVFVNTGFLNQVSPSGVPGNGTEMTCASTNTWNAPNVAGVSNQYAGPLSNGGSSMTGNLAAGTFVSTLVNPSSGVARFPALTRWPDGTWFAGWWKGSGFETFDGVLSYSNSLLGAEKWTTPVPYWNSASPVTGALPFDTEFTTLPSGQVQVTVNASFDDIRNAPFTMLATLNTDRTVTFSLPTQITSGVTTEYFLSSTSKVIAVDGGSILLLPVYLFSTISGLSIPGVVSSTDGGHSYSNFVATAALGAYTESNGFQVPYGYPNGGTIYVMLRGTSANGYALTTSSDKGKTWTTPVVKIPASTGELLGRPSFIFLSSGAMFLMGGWETGVRKVDYWTSRDSGVTFTSATQWAPANGNDYQSLYTENGNTVAALISGILTGAGGVGIQFTEFLDGFGDTLDGNGTRNNFGVKTLTLNGHACSIVATVVTCP